MKIMDKTHPSKWAISMVLTRPIESNRHIIYHLQTDRIVIYCMLYLSFFCTIFQEILQQKQGLPWPHDPDELDLGNRNP
jgi:hypothetical protein